MLSDCLESWTTLQSASLNARKCSSQAQLAELPPPASTVNGVVALTTAVSASTVLAASGLFGVLM